MPKLGLTMTEGVVAEWLVLPGGRFEKDQPVFVVETDKAANEIAAPQAGTLLTIAKDPGSAVAVGTVLAYWEDGIECQDSLQAPVDVPPQRAAAEVARLPVSGQTASPAVVVPGRVIATPLARTAARRMGVDLARVKGSGPHGRIKMADVIPHLRTTVTSTRVASGPAWRRARRVEPTKVHLAMANRLAKVKREVPHFYLAQEAHVGPWLSLRAEQIGAGLPSLSLTYLIVAAVGRALRSVDGANRVWAEGAWLELEASDVGLAVHTDRGLLVPVIRDAGLSTVWDLARKTQTLIERARAGGLRLDDMLGGSITVANTGKSGVSSATPVINPGQSMVLGVGAVRSMFRPDAHGQPELRQELGLVLACDHRVFDGTSGVRFLKRVIEYLETPRALFESR